MWCRLIACLLAVAGASYADSAECASCHRQIYERYRLTGMGKSLYRPTPENTPNGTYYHEASDQHYTMSQRGGRYYQRRHHQIGPDCRAFAARDRLRDRDLLAMRPIDHSAPAARSGRTRTRIIWSRQPIVRADSALHRMDSFQSGVAETLEEFAWSSATPPGRAAAAQRADPTGCLQELNFTRTRAKFDWKM